MSKLTEELDGIYQFMTQAYFGNWQYRWSQTPYLQAHLEEGKQESISGHQWSCMGFWLQLRRAAPALAALVDPAEVYERIWSHDLGETFQGDVSQFRQVNGEGLDKHKIEREELRKMSQDLPKTVSEELLRWFDEFESPHPQMRNLAALIAKLIDTLQGDHFAMVFGRELAQHSEVISKIVNRTFNSVVCRLLEVLKAQGHTEAYQEVRTIAEHHFSAIRKSGVNLTLDRELP